MTGPRLLRRCSQPHLGAAVQAAAIHPLALSRQATSTPIGISIIVQFADLGGIDHRYAVATGAQAA
jgi:hypothetical protein